MRKLVTLTRVNSKSYEELRNRIAEHEESCEKIMYAPNHMIKATIPELIEGCGEQRFRYTVHIVTNQPMLFCQWVLAKNSEYPCYMDFADITITDY